MNIKKGPPLRYSLGLSESLCLTRPPKNRPREKSCTHCDFRVALVALPKLERVTIDGCARLAKARHGEVGDSKRGECEREGGVAWQCEHQEVSSLRARKGATLGLFGFVQIVENFACCVA